MLEGVRSAMDILAAARFQPDDYQRAIPAEDVPDVYEHLAVHLEWPSTFAAFDEHG